AVAAATIGPAPGDTITYNLTVQNTGTADATGVVLTDVISPYTSWASGGTFNVDHVNSTVGTLAAGSSSTLTYTLTVNSAMPNGVTNLNTAGSGTSPNATAPAPVSTLVNTGASPNYTIVDSPSGTVADPLTTLSAAASATTVLSVASASQLAVGNYIA